MSRLNWPALAAWLLARARERSTWVSLLTAATALGLQIGSVGSAADAIVGIVALLGAAVPDSTVKL